MSHNGKDKLFVVGQYKKQFNEILNINLPCTEIYQSEGLQKHIIKKHSEYISYMDRISEIIESPDYIGINPKEPNSIEIVKNLMNIY